MNKVRRPTTTLICLSLTGFLLGACGVREEDEFGDSYSATGEQTATSGASAAATTASQALTGRYAGTYLQECLPIDNRGPNFNQRFGALSMFINGNAVTTTHYYYADSSCSQPSIPANVETSYVLSFPGGTAASEQPGVVNANFGFESMHFDGYRPSTAERVGLEALGFYDSIYDIIKLDESLLYIGSGRYKNTPEDRPEFLSSYPLVRQ